MSVPSAEVPGSNNERKSIHNADAANGRNWAVRISRIRNWGASLPIYEYVQGCKAKLSSEHRVQTTEHGNIQLAQVHGKGLWLMQCDRKVRKQVEWTIAKRTPD